jgi:hypothetical protein
MYSLVFGREPTSEEASLALAFVAGENEAHEKWARYAQALLVSNEFVFVD